MQQAGRNEFLQGTITAAVIRDDDVYPGVRASLEARLATARLKFSVDFNVGDPVVPAPIRTAIPVLLGDEPIEVLAYPKVMVVAEKLVTALERRRANTRWRDFADLFVLVPGDLVESEIIEALRAVAKRRHRARGMPRTGTLVVRDERKYLRRTERHA